MMQDLFWMIIGAMLVHAHVQIMKTRYLEMSSYHSIVQNDLFQIIYQQSILQIELMECDEMRIFGQTIKLAENTL